MAEICTIISNRCEHGKSKRYCKECSINTFCSHNKQKRFCKECEGSNVCEHKLENLQDIIMKYGYITGKENGLNVINK